MVGCAFYAYFCSCFVVWDIEWFVDEGDIGCSSAVDDTVAVDKGS